MSELRFFANVNIEKPLIDFLQAKRYDVKWVAQIDKQMSDNKVCELANNEKRVVLTNDKDFGEMVFFQKKLSYGIVLLRLEGQNADEKIIALDKLLSQYSDKIVKHFVVVKKQKYRFIPLEVK